MKIFKQILILTFVFFISSVLYAQEADQNASEQQTEPAIEDSSVNSTPDQPKEVIQKGATFFVKQGGDLGKLMQRKHPANAEGHFTINIEKLPQKMAQISINAFDLDEERGETNTIYFNDKKLGDLSGTDNAWNTTVFTLEPEWVKEGENKVRFVIGDSSRTGKINWSGKVGWAQLLIDGGSGDTGNISSLSINILPEGSIQTASQLDIKKEGTFKLETTVIDPSGNAVASKIEEFSADAGEVKTAGQEFAFDPKSPTGDYKVVANLFFETAISDTQTENPETFWIQQQSKESKTQFISQAVEIQAGKEVTPVIMQEDDQPVSLNLNEYFTLKGISKEDAAAVSIMTSVISNAKPELLQADLKENILTLTPLKDQNGNSKIIIEGSAGSSKLSREIPVEIKPVDDPPFIKEVQPDITVTIGAEPLSIPLNKFFGDVDSPLENISFSSAVQPEESSIELVKLNEQGNMLEMQFSDQETGSNQVQITANSAGLTTDMKFNVIINPADSIRVKTPLQPLEIEEDSEPVTISLEGLFEDAKSETGEITMAVQQVTVPEMLTAEISGADLTFQPQKDQNGEVKVFIRGTSRGLNVDTELAVQITPIDDAPVVQQELEKLVLDDDQPFKEVDLSQLFTDIDNEDSEIEISVNVEPNDKLIHDLQGKLLTLQATDGGSGWVKTTITGTSNGKSVDYEFPVYVDLGDTFQFSMYGVLGMETVKGYSGGYSYGVGGSVSLNRFLPGLKAEVEYLRSSGHESSGTESGVGYTSKLEMQIVAAYVGINVKIPDSWMEPDSFLTKVEITAKAGQALVMQKISSTPDSSSRATANDDVNATTTVSASGFSAGYYLTEEWFAFAEQLFIGSDIQITRAGIRYDF